MAAAAAVAAITTAGQTQQSFFSHMSIMHLLISSPLSGDIAEGEELTHTYISLEWRTCFSDLNKIVNGDEEK